MGECDDQKSNHFPERYLDYDGSALCLKRLGIFRNTYHDGAILRTHLNAGIGTGLPYSSCYKRWGKREAAMV